MKTISKHALIAIVILSGSSISANDSQDNLFRETIEIIKHLESNIKHLDQKSRNENLVEEHKLKHSDISTNDSQNNFYKETIEILKLLKRDNEHLKQKARRENLVKELRMKFSDAIINFTDDDAHKQAYVIANKMDEDSYQERLKSVHIRNERIKNKEIDAPFKELPTKDSYYVGCLKQQEIDIKKYLLEKNKEFRSIISGNYSTFNYEFDKTMIIGVGHHLYFYIVERTTSHFRANFEARELYNPFDKHKNQFLESYQKLNSEQQKRVENYASLEGINLKEIIK